MANVFRVYRDSQVTTDRIRAEAAADDANAAALSAKNAADLITDPVAGALVRADEAIAEAEVATTQATNAATDALAASGVEPSFISFTTGVLPNSSGAVVGTIGAYYTPEGTFQRVEWDGSQWQPAGESILTEALKELNINDSYQGETLSVDGGLRLGQRKPKAAVSFIDDDGRTQVFTELKPIFDAKGIKGGIAIITGLNGTAPYITWEQTKQFQDEGWEILSHTVNHLNLNSQSQATISSELSQSRIDLLERGFNVKNFVPPFGAMGGDFGRSETRSNYRASFVGTLAGQQYSINYPYEVNSYKVHRIDAVTQDAIDNPSLNTLKAFVDEAKANNGWVVFTTHAFYDGFDATQKQVLSDLIDYIQAEGVDIILPDEGMDRFGNVIDIGDSVAPSGPYFKVAGNGRAYSSSFADIRKANGLSGASSAFDWPSEKTTTIEITTQVGTSGLPTGVPGWSLQSSQRVGFLTTHKFGGVQYVYQEFFSTVANRMFVRNYRPATNDWGLWRELTNQVDSSGSTALANADPLSLAGPISIRGFSSAEASANSLPTGTAGVLVVYTGEGVFNTFQVYHVFRSNNKFTRFWNDQTSQWSAWSRLAGGATGSFTAASGQTITVANGIITEIS